MYSYSSFRVEVLHTSDSLKHVLAPFWKQNKPIGFVPTMGALHPGHISLVDRCAIENEVTVVSIFVNPTQFNDPRDLEHYPRTLSHDVTLLQNTQCDYIFAPSVQEVYPEPDTRLFGFGPLEQVMEGAHRPAHFNGVAQVVSKLFNMVAPRRAYFGEKDFQQLAIIKDLVKQLNIPVQVVPCPIVREADGLAMSSRNALLTPEQRKSAALISDTLMKSLTLSRILTIESLCEWVIMRVNSDSQLHTEYFSIVGKDDLQPASSWDNPQGLQGCIAVQTGSVRLIDNVGY